MRTTSKKKTWNTFSTAFTNLFFSGSCGVSPCPNDSSFDLNLNTSWIDGLARMKYSSWIWGCLATWMTWKGKKGNDKDMERIWEGHERSWKDTKVREGKWVEMKGKAMIINKTNPHRWKHFSSYPLTTLLSWGSYEVPPCPLDLRLDVNTFSIKSLPRKKHRF